MDRNFRRLVPNGLTMLNLLCGGLATLVAILSTIPGGGGAMEYAVYLIFAGAVFDVFDGLSARLLGVPSPMGVQLDSMADLVTFGFAPAAIYFSLMSRALGIFGLIAGGSRLLFMLLPLALLLGTAYRLAKFNIDTRQTYYFIGLASPASALFTCGLALGTVFKDPTKLTGLLTASPWVLSGIILLQSYIVWSEIPMFSLKFKRFGLGKLLPHLLLAAIGAPALYLMHGAGLWVIMLAYIGISLLTKRIFIEPTEEGERPAATGIEATASGPTEREPGDGPSSEL